MGNYPVRFGGGRLEKGRDRHLASRLPYAGHSAGAERNSTVRSRARRAQVDITASGVGVQNEQSRSTPDRPIQVEGDRRQTAADSAGEPAIRSTFSRSSRSASATARSSRSRSVARSSE